MARTLEVRIVGDASSYNRALGSASKQSGSFGASLGKMAKAGVLAAGAAGVGALFVTLKTGFQEIVESQKVMSDTNAILKATGGIANVTAKDVANLAMEQSQLTGVDDELIQAGENLLLTFKNVRNEVGQGNAVFDRATTAALDLAQVGFGSVESSSKMLGKALNDPIKGLTALSRAGVTFSGAQKETIKGLVATGDTLAAQKLILAEVESQVGGAAAAYGDTLPGQLNKAKNAFGEVSGELTVALLPAVTKTLQGFTSFLQYVQTNLPAWKQAIVENSRPVIEILMRVWEWVQQKLIPVFMQIGKVAIEEWTAIGKVFREHGPEIRRIIERITAVVKPLIEAWLFLAENVVIPIIKPLFTVVIPTALGIAITAIDKVTAVLESLINAFKWIGNNVARIFKTATGALKAPAAAAAAALEPFAAILARILGWMDSIIFTAEKVGDALGKVASAVSKAGGFLGGVASAAGKITGRQRGGPVWPGADFLVGEHGPEILRMRGAGTVIPPNRAAMLGGGGGTLVNNNFHIAGSVISERELFDIVKREENSWRRRNGGTSAFGVA